MPQKNFMCKVTCINPTRCIKQEKDKHIQKPLSLFLLQCYPTPVFGCRHLSQKFTQFKIIMWGAKPTACPIWAISDTANEHYAMTDSQKAFCSVNTYGHIATRLGNTIWKNLVSKKSELKHKTIPTHEYLYSELTYSKFLNCLFCIVIILKLQ